MNRQWAVALCIVIASALASLASAGDLDRRLAPDAILSSDAKVEGASIGEWTGRWWAWVYAQPIAPFLDPDGRICNMGQGGPVWFLAGTDGTFSPQRECVVPEDKYLLVPVINMVYREIDSKQPRRCVDMQADAAVNNDHLISAVVLIDGKSVLDVSLHRVRSDGCFVLEHDEEGSEVHAAADGYWLMLKPLSRGRHTLTIGANYGAPHEDYGHMLQNFEYVLDIGGRTRMSQAPGRVVVPASSEPENPAREMTSLKYLQ